MRKYTPTELETFLRAVDENLTEPFTLVVIGGTAAALAYHASLVTADIDTMNDVTAIQAACAAAASSTGLRIRVSASGVADAPYAYEERLQKLVLAWTKQLTIVVPERHDLALMKLLRGDEHDMEHIAQIHTNMPLSLDVLLGRWTNEMGHVVGRKSRHRFALLALVERLFGEDQATKLDRTLP